MELSTDELHSRTRFDPPGNSQKPQAGPAIRPRGALGQNIVGWIPPGQRFCTIHRRSPNHGAMESKSA